MRRTSIVCRRTALNDMFWDVGMLISGGLLETWLVC